MFAGQLSQDECEFFAENGYLGPFTLCPPEQMAKIAKSLRETIERRRVKMMADPEYAPKSSRFEEEPVTAGNQHLRDPALYRLITGTGLIERMASLMGPNILLWRTMVWVKKPNCRIIFWHQDTHKKKGYGDMNDISCWLAIDEATVENGCVELMPGTHRSVIDRTKLRTPEFADRCFSATTLLVPEMFEGRESVKMTLAPGQFFLFSQLTLHGSAPNLTDRERMGIALRFIPTRTDVNLKRPCVLVRGEDKYGHQDLVMPPCVDDAVLP